MFSVSKIGDAAAAAHYFKDVDDYYRAEGDEDSAAQWFGTGADAIGLRGHVTSDQLTDLLAGKVGGQQVYEAGYREHTDARGRVHKKPAHTPGWDLTFSAPKSVSVAALVLGDGRLIRAHDEAVRETLAALESRIGITRQRDGRGGYVWRSGGKVAFAIFRHASSRDLDAQLHSHALAPNVMRDPGTGEWVSIDSREGIYKLFREAEALYKNAYASKVRGLGYEVDWTVNAAGFPDFELTSIPQAVRDLYSSRKAEIDAKLAAGGMSREQATRAQRQAAALDTRSPKRAVPGAELRRQWRARLASLGMTIADFVRPTPAQRVGGAEAAVEAVAYAAASLSDRAARFTPDELRTEAAVFSQGRADNAEIDHAVQSAVQRGDLIAAKTLQRVPGGSLGLVAGYTTREGQQIETDMLGIAQRMAHEGHAIVAPGDGAAVAAEASARAEHPLTDEQKAAIAAVLAGASSVELVQGLAGTAKTSGVLRVVAGASRERGWTVHAVAQSNAAADKLGAELGAKAGTVTGFLHARSTLGARDVVIVDEASLTGARDMRDVLAKVHAAGAKAIVTGDAKQIGSVAAGRAFEQLQDALPEHTHKLTKIFRQRNADLLAAVEAAAQRGEVSLNGIDVREHPVERNRDATPVELDNAREKARVEAVRDVVNEYVKRKAAGGDVVVVTAAVTDRDEVNAGIQTARKASGDVGDFRDVQTLRGKGWTPAQQADAARYAIGDVIRAHVRSTHLAAGATAEVIAVRHGKVRVRGATGDEWEFDPKRYKTYSTYDHASVRLGVGDEIVFRGTAQATWRDGTSRTFRNNDRATVLAHLPDGGMAVRDSDGKRYAVGSGAMVDLGYASTIDAAQGLEGARAVGYMRATQTNLATMKRFYVTISRARDGVTLVTDDAKKLATRLERHSGRKETALAERDQPDAAPRREHANGTDTNRSRDSSADAQRGPTVRETDSTGRVAAAAAFAAGIARSALAPSGPGERPTMGDLARHAVAALRDDIHDALRQREPARLTDAQAATAATLAWRAREERASRLIRRDPPTWKDWRRMVGRNGVAVARDGTRFTVDNDGRVYSDRMFRADNREAVRTAWIDHRERRQAEVVGGRFNRHVILSGDHGRTWRKAKLGDLDRVVAARYGAWKRGRQQARLEADRLRWQATGGKETHDSTWLARESIKSFRQREAAIFKGHLDWDVLAARNGVAYDRDGRRYTVDARGRVWSEALAKRSWAVEHSRAGREAAQAMQRHAHHAARYRMARHRVEKAIGDGQQRELDRLASMALSVADKRWRDAGRVETRDSAEMAREAVAAARRGHFDWNQAALERGVQYDRDGRRYATDNAGRLRVEALEKTAWHYQHDAAAREAHGRQDRARSTGPLAWWRDRKTSAALRQSVERERRSLEDMGGFPREQERTVRDAAREQSAARHAKRERQPRDRSR